MLKLDLKTKIKETILIAFGVALYTFGFVKFNMAIIWLKEVFPVSL